MSGEEERQGQMRSYGTADHRPSGLGESARAALIWGGGSTLFRDLAQFGAMLLLVRLLSPADYGSVALAQSILGLVSVLGLQAFLQHALQVRDPSRVDWQAHFTIGVYLNSVLCACTLCVAWYLSTKASYAESAAPLAVLSLVFLVEIPASLRHRMLEVQHDWRRFRMLVTGGTFLGLGVGIALAVVGGGRWALVVQPILFGVPAAIDLFVAERWKPTWTWRWGRYRDVAAFGGSQIASMALGRGRQAVEQTRVAASYDMGALGEFTRAIGLATMVAGRIPDIFVMAVYPVLTRAEPRSPQFRRYAKLVLSGTVWATVPAAVFIALTAPDLVRLLYGPRWPQVAVLLPSAAAAVGIAALATSVARLLLANDEVRARLLWDSIAAGLGVLIALALIPRGLRVYTLGLVSHASIMMMGALGALVRSRGIEASAMLTAFLPASVASAVAAGALLAARAILIRDSRPWLRIFVEVSVFAVAFLGTLRGTFPGALAEILEVVPGGRAIGRWLFRGSAKGKGSRSWKRSSGGHASDANAGE